MTENHIPHESKGEEPESIYDTWIRYCRMCGAETEHEYSRGCGAWVCLADITYPDGTKGECAAHHGLAQCYCGWAESGGDGYRELIECGERIEPED